MLKSIPRTHIIRFVTAVVCLLMAVGGHSQVITATGPKIAEFSRELANAPEMHRSIWCLDYSGIPYLDDEGIGATIQSETYSSALEKYDQAEKFLRGIHMDPDNVAISYSAALTQLLSAIQRRVAHASNGIDPAQTQITDRWNSKFGSFSIFEEFLRQPLPAEGEVEGFAGSLGYSSRNQVTYEAPWEDFIEGKFAAFFDEIDNYQIGSAAGIPDLRFFRIYFSNVYHWKIPARQLQAQLLVSCPVNID